MTLIIRDWDKIYENNRTRDLKKMQWVPIPNSHDGDGYTELVNHPHGAAHLGVWLAILQVASKCDVRGTLLRSSGKPHDAGSISRITRLDKKIISETIPRLIEISWIEESEPETPKPQEGATTSQEPAEISHPTDYGMEGNGMEGKEGKGIDQCSSAAKKLRVSMLPYASKYPQEMRQKFYNYWTEPNKSKTKCRYQLEKTWEIGRRLAYWANNQKEFKKGGGSGKSYAQQDEERRLAGLRKCMRDGKAAEMGFGISGNDQTQCPVPAGQGPGAGDNSGKD